MALSETAHEIYSACQLVPGEGILDAVGRIEAILAEVRKQDDELIQQLLEALCECAEDSQEQLDRMEVVRLRDYKPNAIAWQEDTIAKAKAAIVAGRARLGSKP